MDHAATMRRAYDLLNAGDIDGFGELWRTTSSSTRRHRARADAEGRHGVLPLYRAAFREVTSRTPPSGDNRSRMRATGTHR